MTAEGSVWVIVGIIFLGMIVVNALAFIAIAPRLWDNLCKIFYLNSELYRKIFKK